MSAGAQERLPAARLAVAYLLYFGAVGIFTPFWSPYLALRGFDAVEIGLLLAVAAAVRAVGPLGFGWLADATGRPTTALRLAALVSVASLALLPLLSGLAGYLVFMVLFSLGWNSIAPSLDAHTLARIGPSSARYGRIRLWGSVGFIAASWLGGLFLQRFGYAVVPTVVTALALATLAATLSIAPAADHSRVAEQFAFRTALRSRAVVVSLLIAALMAVSFGPYYAFYSLYLETYHYSKVAIGFLWALGVLAELGIFAAGGAVLERYSIRSLFIGVAVATAIRWMLIALFVDRPLVIAFAQLLHCMGFAVLHFAIVLTAQRQFPDAAGRGQALFSSIGYGLGGMVGSLLAGMVWTAVSPQASYLCAAVVVVLAALCATAGLRGTSLDRTAANDVPTGS